MKKLIMPILMFIGSFGAINTGMYFFLDATQPKTNTQVLLTAQSDSLHADEGKGDSALHTESIAAMNSNAMEAGVSKPFETGKGDQNKNDDDAIDKIKSMQPQDIAEQKTAEPIKPVEENAITEAVPQIEKVPLKEDNSSAPVTAAGDTKEMAKLSKMLESMKPAEAAAVLVNLKDDAVVTLMMKMKERNAAKVLAAMPIDQAARVAERMAEMAEMAGRTK